VIVVDTHVLIFDAIAPSRMSSKAKRVLARAAEAGSICCSDISLWEIAMLIFKKRIDVKADPGRFIDDIVQALRLTVLPISPEIAVMAQSAQFLQGDPADRLIACTAVIHDAELVTADETLRSIAGLKTIW
jgi:PIN domain nuclease of toxin-antitoxin system